MTATSTSHSTPSLITSEDQLDEALTRPSVRLVEFIRQVRSPLLVLGAGGKMGPTLAVLARRAADAAGHPLRVSAVSRFHNPAVRTWLEERGVETISCDLFNGSQVDRLPDAGDIIYLVGVKFGTTQNPALTWAANTIIPTNVAGRFPQARIVALSTGNVYPLVPVADGGATETHSLTPVGEYANAAVARERMFEFHASKHGTPMVLVRLNYAVELRYGVLHDLAAKVWAGQRVDLTTGRFNCIWQGDANDAILRSLALTANPPLALNLTGPELLSVRAMAGRLGELMGKPAMFTGTESAVALLNNPAHACKLLGPPPTPLETVLRWTAQWVMSAGPSLNKPTHFEIRDGRY
jgi:nucleoside-diphosphate-sugar epimerase